MKKLIALVLLLCLLPCAAHAQTKVETILLPRAQVSYEPVPGGYCLTRESSASVFNRLGFSQREMVPHMEETDLYALMWDASLNAEFQLIAFPTENADMEGMKAYGVEWLRADFRRHYEESGYEVEDVYLYRSAGHEYIRSEVTYTYEDGLVEPMIDFYTVQNGYVIEVVVFSYQAVVDEKTITLAENLVDSVWCGLLDGYTQITEGAVSLQMWLPEDMALCKGEEEGCWEASAPDGSWSIRWHIFGGVSGDADRLSDAGARALYEDRSRKIKAAGGTVASAEHIQTDMHRYTHIGYQTTNDAGMLCYVDEYYTKQSGYGLTVEGISEGVPLSDEALSLLRKIVDSQIVRVAEE